MECVGQFAGFSQKFESDVLNDSVTLFDEHVNVFILRFIHLHQILNFRFHRIIPGL